MRVIWVRLWQLIFTGLWAIALSLALFSSNSRLALAQSKRNYEGLSPNTLTSFMPLESQVSPIKKIQSGSVSEHYSSLNRRNLGSLRQAKCFLPPHLPLLKAFARKNQLKFTTSDRPTFWLYLPYTFPANSYGEFSLKNADNKLYRARFPLPATPGIISIELPARTAPLEVNKHYRWSVALECSTKTTTNNLSNSNSLTGLVKRLPVSLKLEQELETVSVPIHLASAYGKYGIWHNTVTRLMSFLLQQPPNFTLKEAWRRFLGDR
ncbi:MAG TPA: DUF928 domain-containing protein [Xenococcaceae cyanobacterium]